MSPRVPVSATVLSALAYAWGPGAMLFAAFCLAFTLTVEICWVLTQRISARVMAAQVAAD